MTTNFDELKAFLILAKKSGYASGEGSTVREKDGSYSTRFSNSNFSFHDSWFGGEPFGGREAVFKNNKPYWMMVYYGSDSRKAKNLIPFLRNALSQIPSDMPVRGPKYFKKELFEYKNTWTGIIGSFYGHEEIFNNGEKVYEARYSGGLVDQILD